MRAVPTCWARTGPALSGVGGDGAGRGAGRGAGGGLGGDEALPQTPLSSLSSSPRPRISSAGVR